MNIIDLVKESFSFLESQYHFSLVNYKYDPEYFGNEIIAYSTNIVGIKIVKDRGEISIYLGRITDKENNWFDLCDIIPHYASYYSYIYDFPQELSYDERLKFQISKLSSLVQLYCKQLLLGDFSAENDFIMIRASRKVSFIQYLSGNKK